MQKRTYNIDMCSGPLAGKILLFALPLMLSSMLQLLFNAVDVVVVGRFVSSEALAAVGSNNSLINLMINLFVGLSVGANVVIARDLGAGRKEAVSRSIHTTMTMAIISGVLMMAIGVPMARQFLVWMKSPTDVIDLATVYLRIYFMGMPANFVYNFGAAVLRAEGDTQRPLYYLFAAGLANVGLNLLLVIVFGLGVAGVAIGTIASQYISAVLVVLCLMREQGAMKLDLRKLGLDGRVVLSIMKVGLPAGFQGVLFALSNVAIQSSLNSFDDAVMVAGSAASSSIENFVYAGMNSFYQTAISFVGQNYGAGKCKRVDRIAVLCLIFAIITGLVMGNGVYHFGGPLLGIYAPGEPDVVTQGLVRMGIICVPYFLCGIMDVMVGVLRGLGYSVVPMIGSLVGVCGMRLVWLAFVFANHRTQTCLYLSYPVTWIITGSFHILFFFLIRKHAYLEVLGNANLASMKVEGQHPEGEKLNSAK